MGDGRTLFLYECCSFSCVPIWVIYIMFFVCSLLSTGFLCSPQFSSSLPCSRNFPCRRSAPPTPRPHIIYVFVTSTAFPSAALLYTPSAGLLITYLAALLMYLQSSPEHYSSPQPHILPDVSYCRRFAYSSISVFPGYLCIPSQLVICVLRSTYLPNSLNDG